MFNLKADELGARNRTLNEASLWTTLTGILLSILGFMGLTLSQRFFTKKEFEELAEEASKKTDNET